MRVSDVWLNPSLTKYQFVGDLSVQQLHALSLYWHLAGYTFSRYKDQNRVESTLLLDQANSELRRRGGHCCEGYGEYPEDMNPAEFISMCLELGASMVVNLSICRRIIGS